MSHSGNETGDLSEWKPTAAENAGFKCRDCGSNNVWYAKWDSSCGGWEDLKYHCRACGKVWWVEGIDS